MTTTHDTQAAELAAGRAAARQMARDIRTPRLVHFFTADGHEEWRTLTPAALKFPRGGMLESSHSVFADGKGAAFVAPLPAPTGSLSTPESVRAATAMLNIEVERLRKEAADMKSLFQIMREALELTETTEEDRRLLQGLLSKDEKEAKYAKDQILSRRYFKAGRAGTPSNDTKRHQGFTMSTKQAPQVKEQLRLAEEELIKIDRTMEYLKKQRAVQVVLIETLSETGMAPTLAPPPAFAASSHAPRPGQTLSPEKLRETALLMKCSTSQAAEHLMAQRVPLPLTFGG